MTASEEDMTFSDDVPGRVQPPEPAPPPQLGDGFSPPPDEPGPHPLADPAEAPHPAPWGKSDF